MMVPTIDTDCWCNGVGCEWCALGIAARVEAQASGAIPPRPPRPTANGLAQPEFPYSGGTTNSASSVVLTVEIGETTSDGQGRTLTRPQ